MNVLSLFDGMSCGQIALERIGVRPDNYFASEIDTYAIAVTKYNYPDTIQLGDINNWESWDLPKIDLVLAGSPCQGFSIAGKGLNFEDPRSKLFFTFYNLLTELQYRNGHLWFLLENVPMKKEWEDVITEYLFTPVSKINSSLVSAQNRERLYWTNFAFTEPEDRGIMLKDVLLENANRLLSDREVDYMNRKTSDGRTHWDFAHYSDSSMEKSRAVVANFYKGVPYNVLIEDNKGIRKFDPIECERLQTVPDDYTKYGIFDGEVKEISDTQRFKMLGNGWTVDVVAHILDNGLEFPISNRVLLHEQD